LGNRTRRGKRPEKREEARELLSILFATFNPKREREGRGKRHKQEKDSFNFISSLYIIEQEDNSLLL